MQHRRKNNDNKKSHRTIRCHIYIQCYNNTNDKSRNKKLNKINNKLKKKNFNKFMQKIDSAHHSQKRKRNRNNKY